MLPVEPRQPAKVHYKYTTETNFVAMDMWTTQARCPHAHSATTKEDSGSKMVQNHPLVCLKRLFYEPGEQI
jgi:hypothetical protein